MKEKASSKNQVQKIRNEQQKKRLTKMSRNDKI